MGSIEEIWEKGNEQIAQDDSPGDDLILKSISESSIGVSSKMMSPMWMGMVFALMAFSLLFYNLFAYSANPSMLILIIVCLLLSGSAFSYLLSQIGILRRMDLYGSSLREVLVNKIKFLDTRYRIAQHCISLSVVLGTFGINLSMESADGIFELRKILILSVFYLFAYVMTLSIASLSYRMHGRQLRSALQNLEESTLRSLDKEMKQAKRKGRIILGVITVFLLAGIAAMFLFL